VTSATGDISVANSTTTPQLTLNSGTSGGAGDASKLAKLDALGLLAPAMIPTLDVAKIGTGVLPVARGGTSSTTALNNNRVMVSNAGAIVEAAAIAANTALMSDANGIPVASSVTAAELGHLSGVTSSIQTQLNAKSSAGGWANFSVIATNGSGALTAVNTATSGSVLQWSVTGPVFSTASYPVSTTANQLLFSSANNLVGGLATANNAVLTTNGSGVPVWSTMSGDSFSQYALLGGRAGGQTLNGGAAASNNLTLDSTSNGSKGNVLINPSGGSVGVGTTTPSSKLTVAGAMNTPTNVIANGGAVDLSLSNIHVLQSVGGSTIALSNLSQGSSYTIIVQDTAARQYTFTGCDQTRFSPINDVTDGVSETIYGVTTVQIGASWYCYISWAGGFQ
jgi:hypothetical protein